MTSRHSIAPYYKKFDADFIRSALVVSPPYDAKNSANQQWVKGSLRYMDESFPYYKNRELVVTGPKMRLCYNGCKWNKITMAMIGAADSHTYQFQKWIDGLASEVKTRIWANPEMYKPGVKTCSRFMFEDDTIKPSSDPAMYPDELRCKLSTKRVITDQTGAFDEVPDVNLFTLGEDGSEEIVNPEDLYAGWEIVPILKFSYFRNVERFGLSVTVLSGRVIQTERVQSRPNNDEWSIDYQESMDV